MHLFLLKIKKYLGYFFNVERAASLRWRADVNRRTSLFLLLAATFTVYVWMMAVLPPNDFPSGQLVSVPEGGSVQQIARDLQTQGVIRSPLAFRILIKLFGRERGARAGDYLFKEPQSVFTVARAIATGAFGLEPLKIRIPEGATTKQMAVLFATELQRFSAKNFLEEAQPMEGYFFPDTYFFLPNANEESVIRAMRENFNDHMAKIQGDFASSSRSESDIIKMASILEREAFNTEDRRMIAGVLWNRIDRKMALQVDATFLYTIGKNSFQLTRKDLTTDAPYNTYTNKGFPPTPIGSPSMNSIEAALHPIKNNYLYYLADNNGVTYYSRTYEEHLEKKYKYLGT